MIENNLGRKKLIFFPFLFTLALFILSLNLLGLVPYSFTATSHFIVVLALALSTFGAAIILCFQLHAFVAFFPPGIFLALAFLLVPVEIMSFFLSH